MWLGKSDLCETENLGKSSCNVDRCLPSWSDKELQYSRMWVTTGCGRMSPMWGLLSWKLLSEGWSKLCAERRSCMGCNTSASMFCMCTVHLYGWNGENGAGTRKVSCVQCRLREVVRTHEATFSCMAILNE